MHPFLHVRSASTYVRRTLWLYTPHICIRASFHPLTNRKHHCRLCGRIICSLPVKYPQRPQTCSLLFVADPITGQIEEVGEGVDYGVRRRTTSTVGKGKGRESTSDEEKFLKGVRICRDCRPVLLCVTLILNKYTFAC